MTCQLLQRLTGSLGVFLTAYGFLLMSGPLLFQEGLLGIAAQSLWNVPPVRWWEQMLLRLLLPCFSFIGATGEPHPMSAADTSIRQREARWKEMKIMIGGGMILLGAALQIAAYWMV